MGRAPSRKGLPLAQCSRATCVQVRKVGMRRSECGTCRTSRMDGSKVSGGLKCALRLRIVTSLSTRGTLSSRRLRLFLEAGWTLEHLRGSLHHRCPYHFGQSASESRNSCELSGGSGRTSKVTQRGSIIPLLTSPTKNCSSWYILLFYFRCELGQDAFPLCSHKQFLWIK